MKRIATYSSVSLSLSLSRHKTYDRRTVGRSPGRWIKRETIGFNRAINVEVVFVIQSVRHRGVRVMQYHCVHARRTDGRRNPFKPGAAEFFVRLLVFRNFCQLFCRKNEANPEISPPFIRPARDFSAHILFTSNLRTGRYSFHCVLSLNIPCVYGYYWLSI